MNARDNDAKAIRNIRKILRGNMPIETPDELEESPGIIRSAFIVIGCIILASLLMIASCQTAHAQEFSDVQIVNAIYLAEGGSHAQFPFGIRSTTCSGYSSCRKICLTTIKHNRRRYSKYGFKTSDNFISFLGNRYCPTKGKISQTETRLNKYWIKNVNYFLRHSIND